MIIRPYDPTIAGFWLGRELVRRNNDATEDGYFTVQLLHRHSDYSRFNVMCVYEKVNGDAYNVFPVNTFDKPDLDAIRESIFGEIDAIEVAPTEAALSRAILVRFKILSGRYFATVEIFLKPVVVDYGFIEWSITTGKGDDGFNRLMGFVLSRMA